MSPRQEALLDIHSLPWWPDVWQMSALLARQQKATGMPDERSLGELNSSSPALVSLMPSLTAFQALTRPMLALGMGFQLKRTLQHPVPSSCLASLPSPTRRVKGRNACMCFALSPKGYLFELKSSVARSNQMPLAPLVDSASLACSVPIQPMLALGTGFHRKCALQHQWHCFLPLPLLSHTKNVLHRLCVLHYVLQGSAQIALYHHMKQPKPLDEAVVLYSCMRPAF